VRQSHILSRKTGLWYSAVAAFGLVPVRPVKKAKLPAFKPKLICQKVVVIS
jgi:hypothetical protein